MQRHLGFSVANNSTQQNGGPGIGLYNAVDANNVIVPATGNMVSSNGEQHHSVELHEEQCDP